MPVLRATNPSFLLNIMGMIHTALNQYTEQLLKVIQRMTETLKVTN